VAAELRLHVVDLRRRALALEDTSADLDRVAHCRLRLVAGLHTLANHTGRPLVVDRQVLDDQTAVEHADGRVFDQCQLL
jgi:hypothetical protein